MKITDAKVMVSSPGRNFVTLKVSTDQDIFGLGDATLNGRELAVASYLRDHLIPCLIGGVPSRSHGLSRGNGPFSGIDGHRSALRYGHQ